MSGPKTILPSEWMRWVWDTEKGQESPVYESMEQAQRIMALMMRHMNFVASTLMHAPQELTLVGACTGGRVRLALPIEEGDDQLGEVV